MKNHKTLGTLSKETSAEKIRNGRHVIPDGHHWVCKDCGMLANFFTCLRKFGKMPKQPMVSLSTVMEGVCDACGESRTIIPVRDFYHPDMNLLGEFRRFIHRNKIEFKVKGSYD